jgi:protein ImuB
LQLTLARLKAVVGEENVGSPEILDTHRPDAFSLRKFGSSSPSPSGRGWREAPGEGSGHAPSSGPSGHLLPKGEGLALKRSLLLRLFRPPLEATVQLQQQIPIWIAFHGMHGPIVTANGPWRTSGDWWRPSMWDREEWDIEAADALYRIYYDVHLDRWYAQGAYD